MASKRRRAEDGTTVLVRVRRALFVPPERWSKALGFSRPFRRRADQIVCGEGPSGRYVYVPGLPVLRALPFGRFADFYKLKCAGMEGDQAVLYVA